MEIRPKHLKYVRLSHDSESSHIIQYHIWAVGSILGTLAIVYPLQRQMLNRHGNLSQNKLTQELLILKSISKTISATILFVIIFVGLSHGSLRKSPSLLGLCVAIIFCCSISRAFISRIIASAKSCLNNFQL